MEVTHKDERPSEPSPRHAGWAKLFDSLAAKVIAGATAATLVATLIFLFMPGLKPEHPHTVSVSINQIRLERNMTLFDYLVWTTGHDLENISPRVQRNKQKGISVLATLNVQGLRDRNISFTAFLFDAETLSLASPGKGESMHNWSRTLNTGRANEVDLPASSWVTDTSRPGEYFVRVIVTGEPLSARGDPKSTLAVADSSAFRVGKR
jgi:hypothetical protein